MLTSRDVYVVGSTSVLTEVTVTMSVIICVCVAVETRVILSVFVAVCVNSSVLVYRRVSGAILRVHPSSHSRCRSLAC